MTIDEIVAAGGDVDTLLRSVVEELVAGGCAWAGIWFVEGDGLELGPEAGVPDETRRSRVPIAFRGDRVGELAVDGASDRAQLERVAELISPYVLLGWDTGGEAWSP